jgi:polysaccharide deacetylase 2 family uncharacterized protein YibQ
MAKKRPKRAARKRPAPRRIILTGLVLLVGGIVLLKVYPKPTDPIKPRHQTKTLASPVPPKPRPIIKKLPPLPPPLPEIPSTRVAILIDDLGGDEPTAYDFLQINFPLTLSILPSQPHSTAIAQLAKKYQREVLLHLPMEPHGYFKDRMPPHILLTEMNEELLANKTRAYLEQIPGVIGVNNHMGSKFTETPDKIKPVLRVLKEKGLFFIDSRTSKDSVAYKYAKEMGLKAGKRKIFLDNNRAEDAIIKQLMELERLAKNEKEGNGVIAIAHPYPSTLSALRKTLPKLQAMGIEVVPVSKLVN